MSTGTPESTRFRWGQDALGNFLRLAEENTRASSEHLGQDFSRLVSIHTLWTKAMEALRNTPEDQLLAAWFLQQSNSAWLAAVRLALGGQMAEPQAQVRSAIEYAGYALHFTKHPELRETWLRRHDSDVSRTKSRNAFAIRDIKRSIESEDPSLAAAFDRLYEQAIDFGAHPNERALTSRLVLRRENGMTISSVTQLSDRPGDYMFVARTTARAGALSLALFNRVFNTKFRLLSLDVEIENALRDAEAA